MSLGSNTSGSADGTPLLTPTNSDVGAGVNGRKDYASTKSSGAPGREEMKETDRRGSSSSPAASSASGVVQPPFDGHSILLQTSGWIWNRSKTAAPQLTTLTSRTLSLAIGAQATHLPIEDVIGVTRDCSTLSVHSYTHATGCCSGSPAKREHLLTMLTPAESTPPGQASLLAAQWQAQFDAILTDVWAQHQRDPDDTRKRSILILINPASGAGNAARNLETLTPMLQQSGVHYRVSKTTHANHATEMLLALDLDSPNSPTDVVCVSGDGLVHEVVNGLMKRPDWDRASRRIRLGHIGGGSGNGLSSAICVQAQEKIDLVSSMWLILKGYTRPLDVFSINQAEEPLRYGFLSMGYGMISDIDLESESMRYLGNARFTVAAFARICCIRRYDATLEFLAADADASAERGHSPPIRKCHPREDGCSDCGLSPALGLGSASASPGQAQGFQERGREDLERYLEALKEGVDLKSIAVSAGVNDEDRALRWQSLDDAFTLVWSMNVSHGASDMHVAPGAHFSDGCMDMYFVREIGKCSTLGLFLNMENGKHGDNEDISNIKVRGFRLKPTAQRRSELTVDGERLPYKPVEVRVWRGVLNLLAR